MPIALRGTLNHFTANQNNGNDVTLTYDTITPPLEGDIIVVSGGHAATDTAALAAPIGNNSGNFQALGDHSGTAPIFGAWWQRMGATPDTSVLCDGGGNNSDGVQYTTYVLRDVDLITALDVAPTTAGPTTSTNPDPPSITPPTDDAWVIAMAGSEVRDTSPGTISGYTNHLDDTRNETADQTVAAATFDITTNGGSAENPAAWSAWGSGAWYAITAAFRPAAPGDQGINVGQASESNIAQAVVVAGLFTLLVGLATETDIAQAVTVQSPISILVGQASETDIAQPIRVVQPFEISLSSNVAAGGEATTDRLTGGGAHGGGRITDDQNPSNTVDLGDNESGEWAFVLKGTDVAEDGVQYSFRLVLDDDTELDTYSVEPKWTISVGDQTIVVGQAVETDIAQAVTVGFGAVTIAVGQVVETDISQAITVLSPITIVVGQVVETDISQAVTVVSPITITVGQAVETDISQAITVVSPITISVGQVVETDLAQAVTLLSPISILVGQVVETDLAQPVNAAVDIIIVVGQVVETDTAQAVTVLSPITISVGQVTETDLAQTVTVIKGGGTYFGRPSS